MATRWWGTYRNGKWYSPATLQVATGTALAQLFAYAAACIDSGSPLIVFPGECPSPPKRGALPDVVPVTLGFHSSAGPMRFDLSPRGRTGPCGGIGGEQRDRYIFWADVTVDGLGFDDMVGITFISPDELDHPIIGIAEIADGGHSVEFGPMGFRVRQ